MSRHLVTAALGLLALVSSTTEARPLRIGVTDFPPWFVQEGDAVGGIVPSALGPVLRDLGLEPSFELRPIARLKSEVVAGELDCRPASWSLRDEAIYHFSREPLYRLAYSVFARADRAHELEGLETSLPVGLRWGLVHGLTYTEEMLEELDRIGTTMRSWENRDNLLLLLQDRLDVVVAEPLTFLHLAEQEGKADEIEIVAPALIYKDYHLACPHDAGVGEVMDRFDDRFRDFRSSPEWVEILSTYLDERQRRIHARIAEDTKRRE